MSRKISLTDEKIVCNEYQTQSQKQLGEKFGLTQTGIRLVLKRNNVKSLPKYRLNPGKLFVDTSFFEKIDTNEKSYWLGYICADGNIKKTLDKCSLISKDIEIIERFKKVIKSGHKININNLFDKRTNNYTRSYSIQVTNKNFVDNLVNQGITPHKTDIMSVPKMDEKFLPYFFAGLFDGDGYVGMYGKNNNPRISLTSTKEILFFLQAYLIKNFSVSITKLQKVTKNKENVWKLLLYKDSLVFLDWIYSDNKFNYLTRKYEKYKQLKTHPVP